MCRTHKKFIDILSIGAGVKQPQPQRPKRTEEEIRLWEKQNLEKNGKAQSKK